MWNKISFKHRIDVPEDMFIKCKGCNDIISTQKLETTNYTCPNCESYFPISASERLKRIVDEGTFAEYKLPTKIANPIDFQKYEKKIKKLRKETELVDAIKIGQAKIYNEDVVIGVMDSRFMMGSMGSYVGEIITYAFEQATINKLPVVLYTASGGARMQEGIISLMQMAKISSAVKRHSDAGLFYMPILTNPTTGGVTASFAMLGDVIVAEQKALICFAGPRVIKETIKAELPEGFQRAEFLLEHGFLDKIVTRGKQREFIYQMLSIHKWREDEL